MGTQGLDSKYEPMGGTVRLGWDREEYHVIVKMSAGDSSRIEATGKILIVQVL